MVTKCKQQDSPCVDVDYSSFDDIFTNELKLSIDADAIINNSEFCTLIPINDKLKLEDLDTSDYLKTLQNKVGVYHLWVDYDECDDHDKHTMLGVYVGKGFAKQRIYNHIKDKCSKADFLYVSFFECENRLAKYIEQLFLDTYKFHLNKAENPGDKDLYAVWDDFRHLAGTETHEMANIYGEKIGPGPYEV